MEQNKDQSGAVVYKSVEEMTRKTVSVADFGGDQEKFDDFVKFGGSAVRGEAVAESEHTEQTQLVIDCMDAWAKTVDLPTYSELARAADALDSQPTEADARDAARYRLLRDGGNHDYRLCKWAHSGVQVMKRLDGEELDRALDQAAADHKASWMTKATERASSQPTDGGVRNG